MESFVVRKLEVLNRMVTDSAKTVFRPITYYFYSRSGIFARSKSPTELQFCALRESCSCSSQIMSTFPPSRSNISEPEMHYIFAFVLAEASAVIFKAAGASSFGMYSSTNCR
jgi:hypothetical protein